MFPSTKSLWHDVQPFFISFSSEKVTGIHTLPKHQELMRTWHLLIDLIITNKSEGGITFTLVMANGPNKCQTIWDNEGDKQVQLGLLTVYSTISQSILNASLVFVLWKTR